MDRFAARLDEYLTREQPEPTACECGNGLHYEIDRELGQCADCRAEAAHEEERAAGYCNDFGSEAAGPADDEELAAVAAEADEERAARKRTAHVVAVLRQTIALTRNLYATRVASAQRAAKHLDAALDHDADAALALFVGSATEAPAVAA